MCPAAVPTYYITLMKSTSVRYSLLLCLFTIQFCYQEPDMNTASRPLKRKKCFYVVLFYWVCVAWIIYAYNVYANISHVHYTSQIHLLYLFIVRWIKITTLTRSVCDLNLDIFNKKETIQAKHHVHSPYKSVFFFLFIVNL